MTLDLRRGPFATCAHLLQRCWLRDGYSADVERQPVRDCYDEDLDGSVDENGALVDAAAKTVPASSDSGIHDAENAWLFVLQARFG